MTPRDEGRPEARLVRRRFWLEAGLAAMTGLLLVLTLVERQWIEVLFGLEPDGDSGALEWAIVAILAILTGSLSVMTWVEWRRAPRYA